MKTNLQFFAEDRTNMVSLLDIGTLIGSTAKIVRWRWLQRDHRGLGTDTESTSTST